MLGAFAKIEITITCIMGDGDSCNLAEGLKSIFDAVGNVVRKFIRTAITNDIRLKYYGSGVHDTYALSEIINMAEQTTASCKSFQLNFLTNYSEEWAMRIQRS